MKGNQKIYFEICPYKIIKNGENNATPITGENCVIQCLLNIQIKERWKISL